MLRLLGATRRALPEHEHEVLLLGAAPWSRLAARAGLGAHRRLAPLLGVPRHSARAIRRAVDSVGADLIHVWDAESAGIVVAGRPVQGVAATLGAVPLHPGSMPLAQDRVEALCLGDRARRQALAAGWLHGRVRTVAPPSLIEDASRPVGFVAEQSSCIAPENAPDFAQAMVPGALARREALRRAWKVGDDTVVVAVVGDPHTAVDGWLAFAMAARAALAGHPMAVIVHPAVARASELGRWRVLPELARLAIEDDRALCPWELFDGLDAVILPERWPRGRTLRWLDRSEGSYSGSLTLAWASRAGLHVVCTSDGPLDGVLEPSAFVSVAPRANAGALALTRLSPRSNANRTAGAEAPGASMHAWITEVRDLHQRAAASAGIAPAAFASAIAAPR